MQSYGVMPSISIDQRLDGRVMKRIIAGFNYGSLLSRMYWHRSFALLLTGCLLCFSGCGLDEFFVLDAPVNVFHYSYYDSAYDSRYIEFSTNENSSQMKSYLSASSAFKFKGTAVYYKIYNDYSTMTSRINNLSSLSSSTNSTTAATTMIDSYGYKQLGCSEGTKTPLIEATGSDQRVMIRLANYQERVNDAFKAAIKVNKTLTGTPRREGNRHTFDFGRTASDDGNAVPLTGDSDVEASSSASSPGIWYVDLYAVAVGQDVSFATSYSNILHLGSIPIDASSEHN